MDRNREREEPMSQWKPTRPIAQVIAEFAVQFDPIKSYAVEGTTSLVNRQLPTTGMKIG